MFDDKSSYPEGPRARAVADLNSKRAFNPDMYLIGVTFPFTFQASFTNVLSHSVGSMGTCCRKESNHVVRCRSW